LPLKLQASRDRQKMRKLFVVILFLLFSLAHVNGQGIGARTNSGRTLVNLADVGSNGTYATLNWIKTCSPLLASGGYNYLPNLDTNGYPNNGSLGSDLTCNLQIPNTFSTSYEWELSFSGTGAAELENALTVDTNPGCQAATGSTTIIYGTNCNATVHGNSNNNVFAFPKTCGAGACTYSGMNNVVFAICGHTQGSCDSPGSQTNEYSLLNVTDNSSATGYQIFRPDFLNWLSKLNAGILRCTLTWCGHIPNNWAKWSYRVTLNSFSWAAKRWEPKAIAGDCGSGAAIFCHTTSGSQDQYSAANATDSTVCVVAGCAPADNEQIQGQITVNNTYAYPCLQVGNQGCFQITFGYSAANAPGVSGLTVNGLYTFTFDAVVQAWTIADGFGNNTGGIYAGQPVEIFTSLCNKLSITTGLHGCHYSIPWMLDDASTTAMAQNIKQYKNSIWYVEQQYFNENWNANACCQYTYEFNRGLALGFYLNNSGGGSNFAYEGWRIKHMHDLFSSAASWGTATATGQPELQIASELQPVASLPGFNVPYQYLGQPLFSTQTIPSGDITVSSGCQITFSGNSDTGVGWYFSAPNQIVFSGSVGGNISAGTTYYISPSSLTTTSFYVSSGQHAIILVAGQGNTSGTSTLPYTLLSGTVTSGQTINGSANISATVSGPPSGGVITMSANSTGNVTPGTLLTLTSASINSGCTQSGNVGAVYTQTNYQSSIGTNYNAKPNRPIDAILHPLIATYWHGYLVQGASTASQPLRYTNGVVSGAGVFNSLITAADQYAASDFTDAFSFMSSDTLVTTSGAQGIGYYNGTVFPYFGTLATNLCNGTTYTAASTCNGTNPLTINQYEGAYDGTPPVTGSAAGDATTNTTGHLNSMVAQGTLSTFGSNCTNTQTVSSGTYNSGTGAVSLTLGSSASGATNDGLIVNLTGTGSVSSLNGAHIATSGTGTTTVNFTAGTGLTLTITGGTVADANSTVVSCLVTEITNLITGYKFSMNHFNDTYILSQDWESYGPHFGITAPNGSNAALWSMMSASGGYNPYDIYSTPYYSFYSLGQFSKSTNWLLKRDLDPASNDNTPAYLAQTG